MNKNVNKTYISLIAKKEMTCKPLDFRLISLSLQLCVQDSCQNELAFVKHKQIIDYWRCETVSDFIIKLHFEKAFDKRNWMLIDFMLLKKGFPYTFEKIDFHWYLFG